MMSLADGSKRYLTEGFDYNAGNVRWADDSTLLFLVADPRDDPALQRVAFGGPVRVITSGAHDLNAFSAAGGRVVAEMTTLGSPTELFDVNPSDGAMTRITNTNAEIYEHIRMGKVEERWVETTDGKRMLVWVVLPPDFDPSKKYPALLYCQGGPQSVVSQFWSYRWNLQLMAAQATSSWRRTGAACRRSGRSGSIRFRAITADRTSATI